MANLDAQENFQTFRDPQGNPLLAIVRDGSIKFADGSSQSSAAGAGNAGYTVFNVKSAPYNAKGDGSTDDSAAVIAAIQAAYNAGGGIVFFPAGTYLINSQLSIPNTGGAAPNQPVIRLTGVGASMASSAEAGGSGTVFGASVLDLRNNATTAKIDTRGAGYLEIDHLTLKDGGSDSATFVFTTNTVLHIHDCSFYGTAAASAGVSANNDAILLGGTSTANDGTANAAFQGYGTVIRDNFFDKIKRAVVGQTFANGIQIVNNTVWNRSGYATGGAIEFIGVSNGVCTGNYIAGNLIEVTFYKYGIRQVDYCEVFTIAGNNVFDSNGNTTAAIRFETVNCGYNFVQVGWNDGTVTPVSDVAGNSTIVNPQQSQTSIWAQHQEWINNSDATAQVFLNPAAGNVGPLAPTWKNGDGNAFYIQASPSASQPQWFLCYTPNGGATEQLVAFNRTGQNQIALNLLGTGAGNPVIAAPSGKDLKIESGASGGSVWFGDTSVQSVRVTGANLFLGNAGSIIAKYNGVNTVRNGVPSEVAQVNLTAQGAAQAGTSIIASLPSSGLYRVSWVAKVTQAATTSSTLGGAAGFQVIYTDADDSTVGVTSPANAGGPTGNALTTQWSGEAIINGKTGTAVTFNFGYTSSGATPMQYAIHVTLESM